MDTKEQDRSKSVGQILNEDGPRYGTLFVYALKELYNDPFPTIRNGLRCRQVRPDEAEIVQNFMEQAGVYVAGDVEKRVRSGRLGFVGEITEPGLTTPTMVTYGWVALDSEPLGNSGISFQPPPQDAYLYDFATLPAHRGRGYYPTLLQYILNELAVHHLRCAWIGTEPGNDTSARSIHRAGFTKIADMGYVPALGNLPAHFELFQMPDTPPELFAEAQRAHVPTTF